MRESLIEYLAVTWEVCGGKEVSKPAKKAMVKILGEYDPGSVSKALTRCQKECDGRISLKDIIARIDDGRPGAEEAWAMIPTTEDDSVVWTQEMSEAYYTVRGMMDQPVAARMAFKEAYQRACSEAREEKRPVAWNLSAGTDDNRKQRAMLDAVDKKRLTPGRAMELAPHLVEEKLQERGLIPRDDVPQLPAPQTNAKALPGKVQYCPISHKPLATPDEISSFREVFEKMCEERERQQSEESAERKAIRGE